MIQAIRTGGFFHTGRAPHGAKRSAARREKEAGIENATQAQDGQQPQQGQTDPQQGAGEAQPKDYKALYEDAVKESRKWEKRSKDNLEQLNALKQSQGKPDPTIEERIAALEKENGDLKAASARAALVDSVAKATGLDRAIVATLSGADEESLTEQAEAIAAIAKPRGGAPLAPEAGIKQKPGRPSKKEILGIEDKKERMAAIAANIDLFK